MSHHTTLDTIWVMICAALVFVMQAGFLCLETGLVRSKNGINVALKNFTDFCIAACVFWAFGFGIIFGVGQGWLGGWFGLDKFWGWPR